METNHLFEDVIEAKEDFAIVEYLESVFQELDEMYSKKNTFEIKDEKLKELKIQLSRNII